LKPKYTGTCSNFTRPTRIDHLSSQRAIDLYRFVPYGYLNLPGCSCVSITLPAAS
jgi:hypothetical protein